jgi:alcohol dehydrogenase (cytochrome c)
VGLLYANSIDWCTSVNIKPPSEIKGAPGMPWSGMDHPQAAFGVFDPVEKWKGWVTAIDAETGQVRWKVQTPKPLVAAITPTAGGLVFTREWTGCTPG